jgi:hypothetical protein
MPCSVLDFALPVVRFLSFWALCYMPLADGWSVGKVWLVSAVVAFEMMLRLRQRRRGAPPTAQRPSGDDLRFFGDESISE